MKPSSAIAFVSAIVGLVTSFFSAFAMGSLFFAQPRKDVATIEPRSNAKETLIRASSILIAKPPRFIDLGGQRQNRSGRPQGGRPSLQLFDHCPSRSLNF